MGSSLDAFGFASPLIPRRSHYICQQGHPEADQLKEQKATIVELEKQLSTRKEQTLRLEGAIEALNMTLKEEDATEEIK